MSPYDSKNNLFDKDQLRVTPLKYPPYYYNFQQPGMKYKSNNSSNSSENKHPVMFPNSQTLNKNLFNNSNTGVREINPISFKK